MPILSVYVGESQISALYYNSPSDFSFGIFPHVFLSTIFKHDFNEDKFYKQVIKYFEKEMGFDAKKCEVLLGTLNGDTVPFKTGEDISVLSTMQQIKDLNWLLVENFLVSSGAGTQGFFPFAGDKAFSDADIITYFSNKSIYPQCRTTNPKFIFAHEALLKNITTDLKFLPDPAKHVIFTGGMFAQMRDDPINGYLLALGLINVPGVFRVKIDTGNKLPLISMLNSKLMTINNDDIFDDEFVDIGSVLKAPGGAEVLFERDDGRSQFVELKSNQMFIFPLGDGENARVSINGKNVGKLDTHVRGGKVGFVLDGRQYQYDRVDKEWIKVFEQVPEAF